MFTLQQIRDAHSKVKSGTDFPGYIRDLTGLGVKGYETFVNDGHSVYFGSNNFKLKTDARYSPMKIAHESNSAEFIKGLKDHQQGQTDYPAFCRMSAENGIEKWVVDAEKRTCTYYDPLGNVLLTEDIPL